MAVQLTPFTKSQWFDAAGNPLSGGKLFTFQAGTSNNQASFTDSTGSVQNANPVILDSAGRADVWLTAGLTYKLVLQNSAGTQLWSEDNINPALIPGNLTATNVAGNLTITQPTPATGGANQSSNVFEIDANYWNGAASALDKWTLQDVLGTGSNPTSTLTIQHSGSSGVATVSLPTITVSTALTAAKIDSVIYVDGSVYTGAQALQTAIQACSGLAACEVDARNPLIGTQTFTVNPFSGLNMPITVRTGAYTVQWDHSAFFVDFPSHFHWELNGTTILNSTGSTGAGVNQVPGIFGFNTFIGTRAYNTTGTITSGTKSLSVASAANLNPGTNIIIIGAAGGNSNQQTTTNGATGTGTSFVVTSLAGWDNTGTKTNYIQVESEQMACTMVSQTANTFTGCTRGINGTANVSHNNAVNVQAITGLVTQVQAVSGTTVTLQDAATTTVTSAPVYFGVTDAAFDGTGTINFNQTVATTTRFGNFLIALSGNVTIGPGITIRGFDQGGITLMASSFNHILARHYECNGKPPNAQGWDIGIFESSTFNHIVSGSHSPGVDPANANGGDIGLFVDDRSTNSTVFDGAPIGNAVEMGSVGTPAQGYTNCVIIQSLSRGNHVTIPYCKTIAAGSGLNINYDSDWTSNVTPTGNMISFGQVDSTGGTAISESGFSGTGNNIFLGGNVLGGAVSTNSTDYAKYMTGGAWTVVGKDYQAQYIRSGGAFGFADVYGDGTHRVIVGDANGVGLTGPVTVNGTFAPNAAGGNDLGLTALPFGNLWLGTAATNNFKFQPAATAAARVISILDPGAATNLGLTFNATTGIYQSKRVAGCATAASLNAVCDTTVTWNTAFADANYTATCSGDVVTSGVPIVQGIAISAAKLAASITVRTMSITAAAAQFTTIDCTAIHD